MNEQPPGLIEVSERTEQDQSCGDSFSARCSYPKDENGEEDGISSSSTNKSHHSPYIQEACDAAEDLYRREFPATTCASSSRSCSPEGLRGPEGETTEDGDVEEEIDASSHLSYSSPFQDPSGMPIPTFRRREIMKNKCLGTGAFGSVYEVTGFNTSSSNVCNTSKPFEEDEVAINNYESRKFIAEHCSRNSGDARYAIKLLSEGTTADKDQLTQGIADMATEARMLSSVEHPNIIKLRAIASGTVFRPDYFLILDRLYDTLATKCKKWYEKQRKYKIQSGNIFCSQKKLAAKEQSLYEERVHAAFDLSAALSYLHSKRIIHRDIKPQNIGFDIRGDIKIFDFGFSKQLPTNDAHAIKDENGLYKNMTGMCGSPRYMAPEVALKQNYNEKCDVYSFALVLWEMMALKKAFPTCTMDTLMDEVWNSEVSKRPEINDLWVLNIKLLVRRSWSNNINERPSMEHIKSMLRTECVRCRHGDDTGLEHLRRRSTFVFGRKEFSKRLTVLEGTQTSRHRPTSSKALATLVGSATSSKTKKGFPNPIRRKWRSTSA